MWSTRAPTTRSFTYKCWSVRVSATHNILCLRSYLTSPFMVNHRSLFVSVATQHVPKYYVIWGLVISAVTAVTEEVLVNGYLITRLGQLGWTPRKSLILSLILRTSYHVYYGIGFILTVPFGFFVTRSFQKHHKLNRPIVAHFLFDAILISISILR